MDATFRNPYDRVVLATAVWFTAFQQSRCVLSVCHYTVDDVINTCVQNYFLLLSGTGQSDGETEKVKSQIFFHFSSYLCSDSMAAIILDCIKKRVMVRLV